MVFQSLKQYHNKKIKHNKAIDHLKTGKIQISLSRTLFSTVKHYLISLLTSGNPKQSQHSVSEIEKICEFVYLVS